MIIFVRYPLLYPLLYPAWKPWMRSRWLGWISRLNWRIHTCSNSFTPWMWMNLGQNSHLLMGEVGKFPVFMAKICPERMTFDEKTYEFRTWFRHAEPDEILRWSAGRLAFANLTWHWNLAFADDLPMKNTDARSFHVYVTIHHAPLSLYKYIICPHNSPQIT